MVWEEEESCREGRLRLSPRGGEEGKGGNALNCDAPLPDLIGNTCAFACSTEGGGGTPARRPFLLFFLFPQRRMVLQRMRKCNPMDQKKPPREKRGGIMCASAAQWETDDDIWSNALWGRAFMVGRMCGYIFLKDAHVLYKNCFSSIKLFGRLCRFRTESTENWGVVYACKSFTSSGGGPSSSSP